nr:hypothetical protein [Rhizobium leguminosarum]
MSATFDPTTMTLAELRESRAPKYDLMLKTFFSFRYSSLSAMLGIPPLRRLTEETGRMDGLRMDAVLGDDHEIYHVEFQAQNHSMMHERMLDYYLGLVERYTDTKTSDGPTIRQYVLYVGSDRLNMKPYIVRDRFRFCYPMRSIKAFHYGWRNTLWGSGHPEDWILLLLTLPRYSEKPWLDVAVKIANLSEDRRENAETHALLLIACILRNIPRQIQEEIETMIKIDLNRSRIFRQVFDDGASLSRSTFLLDEIEHYIARNGLEFDQTKREDLADLEDEEIMDIFRHFMDASDKQGFLDTWSIGRRYP